MISISATNRGAERKPHDFYATPIHVVNNFLNTYKLDGNILEPCAGNGNIVSVIKTKYPSTNITSVEIREEERENLQQYGDVHISDFLTWQPDKKYDTIISNPPYSIAQDIIEKCFEITTHTHTQIIMLLRLAFLESKSRYDFWQKHPISGLYVLSQRPSFTGKGTDATAYAWFVWNGKEQKVKVI